MSTKRGRKSKSEAEQEYNRLLGARIEAARKSAGIEAQALARAIGVSRKQLYFYEVGRTPVQLLTLIRIAGSLELPLASLMQMGNNGVSSLTKRGKLLRLSAERKKLKKIPDPSPARSASTTTVGSFTGKP